MSSELIEIQRINERRDRGEISAQEAQTLKYDLVMGKEKEKNRGKKVEIDKSCTA